MGRPPQRELPARRRRQIIEAAFEVFTAQGYEATAISEVAARAGIGQGTVYRYFGSKREILDHVIDLGVEKVTEAMELHLVFGAAGDVGELVAVVRAAVERLYELLEREPAMLRLLVVEAGAIDAELAQRLLGVEAITAALITGELTRGMEEGWIRPDVDPEVLGHTILTMVGPWIMRELLGAGNPAIRERSMTVVFDLIDKTLRPRTPTP
ncbi:TetR/AcrR family transcriptional regulator [Nocardia sp. CDC153]|uniref:TetR/AcrR family transcriptional regulator n=1 Tax=Nocardia sp. CDC153 TaxID=3112167 RepID=UPI002DBEAA66|nr:TetR/AcrR family transcriptional regulator [Nocardia sp. CDC153]MEC3957863.1 TetR/AcrR family transcriptional regulator [Nocardia sp. CDC153]